MNYPAEGSEFGLSIRESDEARCHRHNLDNGQDRMSSVQHTRRWNSIFSGVLVASAAAVPSALLPILFG
ncbi:MAG: hypothetical protein KDB01_27315 [Planctomycetaceae bacterium]|nr:hypothetical protein [Planctomycetaceae bacterium]